jgi:hypothetical protein
MSEIARKQAPRFQAHEITPDRVLLELARIAFGDPRKLFNSDGSMKRIHEIADEDAPMLAHVEIKTYTNRKSRGEKNPGDAPHIVTKIKLWDKNAALDKLGRHLKLFADAGPTINLIEGEAAAVARAKMIEELQALARPRPLIEHDEGDKNEQVVRP